jgi:hypothetical protein
VQGLHSSRRSLRQSARSESPSFGPSTRRSSIGRPINSWRALADYADLLDHEDVTLVSSWACNSAAPSTESILRRIIDGIDIEGEPLRLSTYRG